MKKNMLLSAFTLLVTAFLLFFVVSAWYVTNEEASAEGIIGSTAGDQYSLRLERGTFDSTNDEWTWQNTESLSFTNISPGNKFFFRIVIDATPGQEYNFTAAFDGVTSSLIPNKLKVNDGYVASIEANDKLYDLYPIVDDKVTITNDSGDTKTLYTIDGENNIYLADYKLEDAFLFHSIGKEEPDDASLLDSDKNFIYDVSPFYDQNDNILSFDIDVFATSGSVYYYFALEFNDAKSLETIDGVTSSNMYMYQKLSIAHIAITHKKQQ